MTDAAAPQKLPPPDPRIADAVRAEFPGDAASATDVDRLAYARDCWPYTTLAARHGLLEHFPDAIVWAASTDDVRKALALARRLDAPLIPYGGGSGVCGGTTPIHGGIILDLKRLNRVLEIDEISLTVTAEAGINGELLERAVAEKGYTIGHFPSSIYCSTLGGWLATRAAGQLSTRWGNIENMVHRFKAVLPDGSTVETKSTPRAAVGPGLSGLLLGSEGTLCVITEATLRLHPEPEKRGFRAFQFGSVSAGAEAIRRILRQGIFPAAVRLYDELDTFIVGSGKGQAALSGEATSEDERKPPSLMKSLMHHAQRAAIAHPKVASVFLPLVPKKCLLILTFEGAREIADAEEAVAARLCVAAGGEDLGQEPARQWWEHRYKVSYGLSAVFDGGAIADTMEVASTWKKLMPLYDRVREAIGRKAMVMAHFSHAYPDGCSIYFTFAARGKTPEDSLAVYREIWADGMRACLEVGGTISHHHGVGLSKGEWMKGEHGHGLAILQSIKDVLDPGNLLNPGKLGLRGRTK